MGDSLDSVENEDDGVELYHQLDGLWRTAGMQARKWISKVVSATPKEDRAIQLNLSGDRDPAVNALGVSWKSKENVTSVLTTEGPPDTPLKKRCVFRKIASVFDPLACVSPFVVVAKILLQQL